MKETKVKKMYKIIFIFTIVLLYMFIGKVYANSINDIDIDVYIDKNGDANVTETWKEWLNEGTEGYKEYKNLGNSEISDFQVFDDTGKEYQYQDQWLTSESFENKAYKCGINKYGNEIELCWGISNYGYRTYVLKYKISNIVQQYTDTQGIYFNFLNMDLLIYNAKITIHSDFPFSLENSRIWAFGAEGEINFIDGNIVFSATNLMPGSDYMVVMARFQSNIFNTTNNINESFDQIYDDAMKDAFYPNDPWKRFLYIISIIWESNHTFIMYFIGMIVLMIIFQNILFKPRISNKFLNVQLVIGKKDIKLPPNWKIKYCREIPFNKDIFKAYWVMNTYNMAKEQDLKKNLIGAFLLKWIEEDKITICKNKKGIFDIFSGNYAIDFSKNVEIEDYTEKKLFEILKDASGINKILEPNEFKKWSLNNFRELEQWFSSALYYGKNKLEIEQFIISEEVEKRSLFRKYTIKRKRLSPKLKEEAIKLKGLKKYLTEYSLMKEKESIEVKLWEDYLIFAQLFGIANKVEKQFKEMYPELDIKDNVGVDLKCIAVIEMTNIGVNGMVKGRVAEEKRIKHIRYSSSSSSYSSHDYSGSSRDSGGGGSSYSGGGSSAGGSSGGGFR